MVLDVVDVETRYLVELCCVGGISMASRTRLVCQCGMDVIRLLSYQLILCCCCWQALCSLILVLKLLPVAPDVDSWLRVLVFPLFVCVE